LQVEDVWRFLTIFGSVLELEDFQDCYFVEPGDVLNDKYCNKTIRTSICCFTKGVICIHGALPICKFRRGPIWKYGLNIWPTAISSCNTTAGQGHQNMMADDGLPAAYEWVPTSPIALYIVRYSSPKRYGYLVQLVHKNILHGYRWSLCEIISILVQLLTVF
jgi:hypothetical protein